MKHSGSIKVTKSFVLILSIAAFILIAAAPALTEASHKRVITVSLLNDAAAPVPEDLIFKLFSAASAEYEEMVNIQLKVVEYIPYSGDLTLHPMDQAFLLSRLSTKGEIRVIFSNRKGRSESDLIADKESVNHLAGASHPYYGHVIIYDVEGRSARTDRAGNPALLTVIKHEIAHLFGVEHSEDAESFMSTPSSLSFGRWTEEVIRRIDERRQKRWFPNC